MASAVVPPALPPAAPPYAAAPDAPAGSCWLLFLPGCPQGDGRAPSSTWVRDLDAEGKGVGTSAGDCVSCAVLALVPRSRAPAGGLL